MPDLRVAFRLQVRPGLLDEYRAVHSPVRREMLEAIAASGRRSYSLFLDETDGTLFGYYEVDDDDAAQASLAASDVATQWEAQMGRFFDTLDGRADQAARRLPEVFHLESQLAEQGDA
ncbi:MAG: L-rhamnose mutarotase [Microcella pacifica]|uniref:L-rhamnose mutarotase n=1 Tax=Microcella pacifica TaxID=2591847 RepID=UPI0033150167